MQSGVESSKLAGGLPTRLVFRSIQHTDEKKICTSYRMIVNVYIAILVFVIMFIISASGLRNSNVVTAFAWTAWFCTIIAFLRSKPVFRRGGKMILWRESKYTTEKSKKRGKSMID